MKKLTAVLLSLSLLFAFASCGSPKQTADSADEPASSEAAQTAETTEADETAWDDRVVGGWERVETPVVTDEVRTLLEKAAAQQDGMTYTPVAGVASQIVAGRNHSVLCKVAPVAPDAAAKYALVTVYADLEGNAEITQVRESEVEAGRPGLMGGWSEPETPEVTEAAQTALNKATATLTGASYKPVALLSTQVVAGTNYRLLCVVSGVVPEAEKEFMIVQVYEDLRGGAEVTGVYAFDAEEIQ